MATKTWPSAWKALTRQAGAAEITAALPLPGAERANITASEEPGRDSARAGTSVPGAT